MKLSKETYKSYPFPIGLFLGYLLSSNGGIVLLVFLARFLGAHPLGLGFFDGVLRVLLLLVAFIVLLMTYFLPAYIFGYRNGKIYRAIGFYRFINMITVLYPFSFFIGVWRWNTLLVSCGFLTALGLFLGFLLPLTARWLWYHKVFGVRKCRTCGLINTMNLRDSKEEKLKTRYELRDYATKGYVYQKMRKTIELYCRICGGRETDYEEYEKQI